MHRLVTQIGLAGSIDRHLDLLKAKCPYHESDHVLSLAYNVLCGGRMLDDLALRRQDAAYLDAIGAKRVPDATTSGDFLRRFERGDIDDLGEAIHEARHRVWRAQPKEFFRQAIIDVDGTMAATTDECKEGMEMSFKGI